jgi:hypothetical protein
MRALTLAVLAAGAAFSAAPAFAADMPLYPPVIEIPDVDYGYTGSFYLRGSAAANAMWSGEVDHPTVDPSIYPITEYGYGYSVGVGAGYETGTGLRFDVTLDHLRNDGMEAEIDDDGGPLVDGTHTLALRSTVALANAYYDVGFGDGYSAAGGPVAYIGGGIGVAFNDFTVTDPNDDTTTDQNASLAAAGMAGLGYDFGPFVADIGYRALYIASLENDSATYPFSVNDNWVHEVRGTVRYRFN